MSRDNGSSAGCFTVTKLFDDLPCSHRAWRHEGKCSFLHGYERRFTITFGCRELDKRTGFVVDFGDLKDVRALLERQFDHTTVIAEDDPELPFFMDLDRKGLIDLRTMRHPGMEGAAEWVFSRVSELMEHKTSGRVVVLSVEARESRKNAVTYAPIGTSAVPASCE